MHPISEILCKLYNKLLKEGEVFFPLHNYQKEKIDSVVKTVNSRYFGSTRFITPQEKAAAYFCLIIKDHPVSDGNKRLAVLTLKLVVRAFELELNLPKNTSLDELAVSVEKSDLNVSDIIKLLTTILFR